MIIAVNDESGHRQHPSLKRLPKKQLKFKTQDKRNFILNPRVARLDVAAGGVEDADI